MLLGKIMGLIAVIAIPTILNVLRETKNSGTPKTAYKRYIATVFHTFNWYEDELKPENKSWKSLVAVRKRHVVSSKFSIKHGAGCISQKDMAITQFGFLGFIITRPTLLGIQKTPEDLEAFVHFWRIIGYMIGIQDRFNLCTDSYETTVIRCEMMSSQIFRPSLEKAPKFFEEMADALVKGLWCFNPFLDTKAFLFFAKRLVSVPGYHYFDSEINESNSINKNNNSNEDDKFDEKFKKLKSMRDDFIDSMNRYSRFILYMVIWVHQTGLNYFLIRWHYNSQITMSRFLITYFPFLAFIKFGIRDSYVRILRGSDN